MCRLAVFLTLLASAAACADAIDRITPNPPARMVARTQINKSHCIGEAATAICSRIEIVWPQNNNPWLNDWLTGISKNELHTPDSLTLDAAATAFIRAQAQQQGVQGSIADLKLQWTMLGEVGRYRNLLLVRDAQENGTAGRAVRAASTFSISPVMRRLTYLTSSCPDKNRHYRCCNAGPCKAGSNATAT